MSATTMTAPTTALARKPRTVRPVTGYVTIAIVGVFSFLPVAWMVLTSFTKSNDIFQFPPALFDRAYTFDHYVAVLTNPVLMQFVANGLFVSIATTLMSVVIGFAAGYSFSKFRYIGRSPFMFAILLAQMVPEILLLLTLYTSFNALGLLDTYVALILAYTTFTLPLAVWMMKNTFDAVPDELIEAARMDGASEWRIMGSVLFPVVRTSLIAVGLFSFIRAWNDLAFALTLVGTQKQTLPAGLAMTFLGEFQNSYGPMLAASTVTSIPVIVMFLVLQKHFISGAMSGSVK